MAGIADLVLAAQPRLVNANAGGTEGKTWKWTFLPVKDAAGTVVDLSTSTGDCKIYTDLIANGGALVATLVYAGLADGTFSVSLAAASTVGLAVGATRTQPRRCLWHLEVTSGANVIQFWGVASSNFLIYGEN